MTESTNMWSALGSGSSPASRRVSRGRGRPTSFQLDASILEKLNELAANGKKSRLICMLIEAEYARPTEERIKA